MKEYQQAIIDLSLNGRNYGMSTKQIEMGIMSM